MDNFIYLYIIFLILSFTIYLKRFSFAKLLKIVDQPNNRKIHDEPIPSIGFVIFIPLIFLSMIHIYYLGFINFKILLLNSLMFLFFTAVGLIDDRIHLNAKIKIFLIIGFLLIILPMEKKFIITTLLFESLEHIIILNQGGLFFTVICIFFLYNALNFSDGLNGISLSITIFWIVYILLFTQKNIFYYVILFSLIITLIPNVFNKIFIGNTGVNFLSILFSLIFILEYNNLNIKFDQIILLVLIPSLDTIRITIERIINKQSPFKPDKNHLHHLLLKYFHKSYTFIPYLILSITPIILFHILNYSFYVILISILLYFLFLKIVKIQ